MFVVMTVNLNDPGIAQKNTTGSGQTQPAGIAESMERQ